MNSTSKDALPLVAAVIALQLMGGFALALAPLMLGGLVAGLSLSFGQAGLVIFIELSALAFSALVIAPFFARIDYRAVCVVGAVVAVIMNLVTVTLTDTFISVAVSRLFAGLAAGLVYAVSIAA
ncbi:MAG: hypothetical protein ACR2PS_03445, partial [Pseudomonadales bacterium]